MSLAFPRLLSTILLLRHRSLNACNRSPGEETQPAYVDAKRSDLQQRGLETPHNAGIGAPRQKLRRRVRPIGGARSRSEATWRADCSKPPRGALHAAVSCYRGIVEGRTSGTSLRQHEVAACPSRGRCCFLESLRLLTASIASALDAANSAESICGLSGPVGRSLQCVPMSWSELTPRHHVADNVDRLALSLADGLHVRIVAEAWRGSVNNVATCRQSDPTSSTRLSGLAHALDGSAAASLNHPKINPADSVYSPRGRHVIRRIAL